MAAIEVHYELDWLTTLHHTYRFTRLVHGDARGADRTAASWARTHGVPVTAYPADWERYGRSAGHRRNAEMLWDSEATLVVAVPGGRGTDGMVALAERAGVRVVRLPGPWVVTV